MTGSVGRSLYHYSLCLIVCEQSIHTLCVFSVYMGDTVIIVLWYLAIHRVYRFIQCIEYSLVGREDIRIHLGYQ